MMYGNRMKDGEDERVVIHFDLDAFYVTCEREINESLRGVPVAVSQYNPYGTLEDKLIHELDKRLVYCPGRSQEKNDQACDANGCMIAVSYEARAAGVKRNDRGFDAIRKCPNLHIVQVPVKHGKADLTMYRNASRRVMNVLAAEIQQEANQYYTITTTSDTNVTTTTANQNSSIQHEKDEVLPLEVASIDEVYVDVTIPAREMARRIMQQSSTCSGSITSSSSNHHPQSVLWTELLEAASACTTIGGVESRSDASLAANALNKDELRRGSRLQVLDSSAENVDQGSRSWWQRNIPSDWTQTELCLACGAYLAAKARSKVFHEFSGGVFTLSAGVSSNKTLAKLASGLKKPNRQTLIHRMDPNGALKTLFHPLPLGRIRGLGGKFGEEVVTKTGAKTVGQLTSVSLPVLVSLFGEKTAHFLYDIARGICREEVTPRTMPKSIACGKTFRGKLSIASSDTDTLRKWTGELCSELMERLSVDREQNKRIATTIAVSIHTSHQKNYNSKQTRAPKQLDGYSDSAFHLIGQLVEAAKLRAQTDHLLIMGLTISATQFVDMTAGSSTIMAAFERSSKPEHNECDTVVIKPKIHVSKVEKRSAMDKWLCETKRTKESGQLFPSSSSKVNKQTASSPVAKKRKQSATMGLFLTQTRENGTVSESSPKLISAVSLPTLDQIDPDVLKELPDDLRESLMKDINSQKRTKKTAGIQHFFNSVN
eukprot:scaffold6592_cov53-Attheya_sp.AAC.3